MWIYYVMIMYKRMNKHRNIIKGNKAKQKSMLFLYDLNEIVNDWNYTSVG